MPMYVVTLHETVTYVVEVHAPDEEAAGELAKDLWARSDDPTLDFSGCGLGVEVDDCEETTLAKLFT
jgi:hypothetical protein